jgi:hypothetical protein
MHTLTGSGSEEEEDEEEKEAEEAVQLTEQPTAEHMLLVTDTYIRIYRQCFAWLTLANYCRARKPRASH